MLVKRAALCPPFLFQGPSNSSSASTLVPEQHIERRKEFNRTCKAPEEEIMQARKASKRISRTEVLRGARAAPMDPSLWGMLPGELLLKIYTSMDVWESHQQRVVCKEWNREFCFRRCSTDAIPKPYFVTIQHNEHNPHAGIVAYNASARTWTFRFLSAHYRSLPNIVLAFHGALPVGDLLEPFAVEGIMFGKGCIHRSHMGQCFRSPDRFFVFDVQAGRSVLDAVTFGPSAGMEGSAVGMMVDTSKKPHGVKLIVGTPGASTRILDSETGTWKMYPSHMIRNRAPYRPRYSPKACVTCVGKMYIWADRDEIHVYSLEQDRWSTLEPPPQSPDYHNCRGLAHWQKEVYAVTMTNRGIPTLWKLGGSLAWEEFVQMPEGVWAYLHRPLVNLVRANVMRILIVSQCDENLLMHVVPAHERGPKRKPRRHALFSLASKWWAAVEVPKSGMRSTVKGWIL